MYFFFIPLYLNKRKIIEFSLNGFHWIHWTQWILTKSKSGMVTRDSPYLTTDIFLYAAVKKRNFYYFLCFGICLKGLSFNRHQTRDSNGNALSITKTSDVFVAWWVLPLVTRLFLDFVMIHWIRWIQRRSFRENSNDTFITLPTLIFYHFENIF